MFGVQEFLVIGAVLVVAFGAKRLPQLGKSLGSSLRLFKAGLEGKDEDERPVKDVNSPPESKESKPGS